MPFFSKKPTPPPITIDDNEFDGYVSQRDRDIQFVKNSLAGKYGEPDYQEIDLLELEEKKPSRWNFPWSKNKSQGGRRKKTTRRKKQSSKKRRVRKSRKH
jgi:hypothetical protein